MKTRGAMLASRRHNRVLSLPQNLRLAAGELSVRGGIDMHVLRGRPVSGPGRPGIRARAQASHALTISSAYDTIDSDLAAEVEASLRSKMNLSAVIPGRKK